MDVFVVSERLAAITAELDQLRAAALTEANALRGFDSRTEMSLRGVAGDLELAAGGTTGARGHLQELYGESRTTPEAS